jgi:hypothetical protein
MRDDLISRQAAIDALGEEPPVWYDGEDEIAERDQWRRDVAAIEAVPSEEPNPYCPMAGRRCDTRGKEFVWCLTCPHISEEDRTLVKKAVEPKIGRWEDITKTGGYFVFKCSECGEICLEDFDFCPNCGAKMLGEDGEKE